MASFFSKVKEKLRRRFKPTLEEQLEDAQTNIKKLHQQLSVAIEDYKDEREVWDVPGNKVVEYLEKTYAIFNKATQTYKDMALLSCKVAKQHVEADAVDIAATKKAVNDLDNIYGQTEKGLIALHTQAKNFMPRKTRHSIAIGSTAILKKFATEMASVKTMAVERVPLVAQSNNPSRTNEKSNSKQVSEAAKQRNNLSQDSKRSPQANNRAAKIQRGLMQSQRASKAAPLRTANTKQRVQGQNGGIGGVG